MAFTSRAPRRSTFAVPTASASIGPGEYQTDIQKTPPRALPVPFASSSQRLLFSLASHSDSPGPGQYVSLEPSPDFGHQPLKSAAFAARRPRFVESTAARVAAHVPGPGAYAEGVVPRWGKPRVARVEPPLHSSSAPVATAPPSIPVAAQSFGYAPGADGRPVRQPQPAPSLGTHVGHTGRGDDRPAPGDYDPAPIGSQRSVDFSRASGQRLTFAANDVPGPGRYDGTRAHNTRAHGHRAVFASGVQRLSHSESSPLPGPGQYEMPSSIRTQTVPPRYQGFGSRVNRSPSPPRLATNVPGPGAYDIVLPSRPKSPLIDAPKPAFRSSSKRFSKLAISPSPGKFYTELRDVASDLAKKPRGKFGVFGSTDSRFRPAKVEDVPGPGQYSAPASSTSLRASASFVSASERDRRPATAGPPPGAYDLPSAWRPPSQAGEKRDAFLSSAARFENPRARRRSSDLLGPGAYQPLVHALARVPQPASARAVFASRTARFSDARTAAATRVSVPGPGAYDDAAAGVSWHKRSFNVTF